MRLYEFNIKESPSPAVTLLAAVDGFQRNGHGFNKGSPLFFDHAYDALQVPTTWAKQIHSGTGNTAWTYSRKVRDWLEYCEKSNIDWCNVSFNDLRGLRRILDSKKASPSLNNSFFNALSNYYTWCEEEGVIKKSPFPAADLKGIRYSLWRPIDQVAPRFIPLERLEIILSNLNPKYQLAVRVALTTGLRESEVATLEWTWLPSPNETFGKLEVSVSHLQRKGHRNPEFWIPVPIFDDLWKHFDFERAQIVANCCGRPGYTECPNLFLSERGGRSISGRRLSKEFKKARDAAGMGKYGYVFHGLRHTFAVLTLLSLQRIQRQNVNLDVAWELAKRLGHSSPESANTYISALRYWPPKHSDSVLEQAASIGIKPLSEHQGFGLTHGILQSRDER